MKIGELAESTGLSIRALHHYDEMGLLKPSCRSESGHRYYSKNDIIRLHKIISLKQLSLPLEKIGKIIGDSTIEIQEALDRQLEVLEKEIEQRLVIARRLRVSSDYIRLMENAELPDLVKVIKDLVTNESYFTKEQWDYFEKRGKELGDEKIKYALMEIPKIIEEIQVQKDSGSSPSDQKVIQLIQKWGELLEYFIGNDPKIIEQAKKMHKENPDLKERHGITPELMEFIEEAKRAMNSLKDN
ncbi:MAG: MerR family transcriptional regulator [Bdellovibrionaceae bacterium]|nr:MerR family transcriptional regulator [Pseudobdellovibrionaceae bacterium]